MSLIFQKYHGLGNDYLVYDCIKNNAYLNEDHIKLICDRNFGIGSDGILVGPIFREDKVKVKIYNPDGTEAEKSGNGVRIFSKYLKDAEYIVNDEFVLSTLGGDVKVNFQNEKGTILKISMGKLSFMSEDIGMTGDNREVINVPMYFNNTKYLCTCVSIGNPHCVIPMEDISKVKVCEIGQYSERADYFPNRINTQIVKVIDRNNIQIEIFERGAGYTLASGSSSCAAAGAVFRLGHVDNDITVHMPGGNIKIEISDDFDVFMTGSVCSVGEISLSEEFMQENRLANLSK